ncbi:response regulator transcription factor [Cyanobacterium sp. IPPAS B-1200]|uniref:response regulator transcription factor n=1 Tax=Cyanobacterium sp. IPPAS B-1200 TaxID=1562720 RepID=UPI0008526670|nr:response regulator transcription factor [Cyanobacterium sp. IPPAS B-1200]OEJ79664.1 DNA-binding response regulator [Cyanobacterium sp. IPPAS B-1200]
MSLQILVSDDDSTIQHLIKDCLELQGYSVILANDGEKALSLAMKYHPHLLISDIKMPHKDGYQLVQELRKLPPFRLLPVIFLTHQHTMEAKINGYQAGCDVYLAKPFEPMELIAIVKHLLERSQVIQSERLFTEHNNSSIDNNNNFFSLHLTHREKEVLALIIEGHSNIQIAQQLYLSPKTIEKYVANLLKKTDSQNRTELVSFAFKNNLTHF